MAEPDLTTRRQRERDRLIALHAKCPLDDREFPYTGVLLSDGIKYCVDKFDLIRPFDERNLKPANYKVTIGNQYAMNGQIHELSDHPGKNEITIPPFQVVVIKTRETINMPRFLIARWNIRVQLAYKGLLWVGGPQVDAGFVGYLACPIYNLSDKPVTLSYGDPIAVIDFVRTSSFNQRDSLEYKDVPPERFMFEDYDPKELNSALYEVAIRRVAEFSEQLKQGRADTGSAIKDIQSRVDTFVLITFTVIAVLFAAVTIFVTEGGHRPPWDLAIFLLSLTAIFMSGAVWLKTRTRERLLGFVTQAIIVAVLILGIAVYVPKVVRYQKEFEQLKVQVQKLQQCTSSTQPSNIQSPLDQTGDKSTKK